MIDPWLVTSASLAFLMIVCLIGWVRAMAGWGRAISLAQFFMDECYELSGEDPKYG